jgi:MHS family proline/betaine transporter-like MFS transporter
VTSASPLFHRVAEFLQALSATSLNGTTLQSMAFWHRLGPLFFPDVDPLTALINTYGIFAAGYLMRPLGGVIFGRIGDLMGRKKALQLSIIMMAVPTVLVGMLPVYEQIGAFAAVLLVLLRLMQGISVGGELTGSMSYLVETAPANRRGLGG